jgi:heptosyltransferase-2
VRDDGGAINMAKALGKPSFTIFSPWIERKSGHIRDGIHHMSGTFKDYKPELLSQKKPKRNLNRILLAYIEFKPKLI